MEQGESQAHAALKVMDSFFRAVDAAADAAACGPDELLAQFACMQSGR